MILKQVKEYDKFIIRLPDGMRDKIAKSAELNGRSMNSEIIQALSDYLDSNKGADTQHSIIEKLESVVAYLEELKKNNPQ